jgi:hypothetical protein
MKWGFKSNNIFYMLSTNFSPFMIAGTLRAFSKSTTDFHIDSYSKKISERAKPEKSGDAKPRVLTIGTAGLPKR